MSWLTTGRPEARQASYCAEVAGEAACLQQSMSMIDCCRGYRPQLTTRHQRTCKCASVVLLLRVWPTSAMQPKWNGYTRPAQGICADNRAILCSHYRVIAYKQQPTQSLQLECSTQREPTQENRFIE